MGAESLAGAGISALIGGVFSTMDAKKQRALQSQLANLSLAQQKELELHLQDVNGELAKQKIIYEYLAVQKNNEYLAKIKGKRYVMYSVLGVGVIVLGVLILKLASKK